MRDLRQGPPGHRGKKQAAASTTARSVEQPSPARRPLPPAAAPRSSVRGSRSLLVPVQPNLREQRALYGGHNVLGYFENTRAVIDRLGQFVARGLRQQRRLQQGTPEDDEISLRRRSVLRDGRWEPVAPAPLLARCNSAREPGPRLPPDGSPGRARSCPLPPRRADSAEGRTVRPANRHRSSPRGHRVALPAPQQIWLRRRLRPRSPEFAPWPRR